MPKPSNPESHAYMFTDDIKFLQKVVVFHPSRKGQFVILKRTPDSHSRPNDWDFPGGNVLFGELHQQSLLREVKEETQMAIKDLKPVQVKTDFNFDQQIYFIFVGHQAVANSTKVRLSQEHTEYKWVTLPEFNALKPADFLIELADLACKKFED
jgi:8-oxo-dGTP diphosphatase